MSIRCEQHVAATVLSVLSKRFDCLVAGGAPRDWYFGRECKDIDVFVAGRPSKEELQDALRMPLEEASEKDYSRADFTTYNTEIGGKKVQIMSCQEDRAMDVVEIFPSSLSKAWYDGECHYHPHFLMSVKYSCEIGDMGNASDNNLLKCPEIQFFTSSLMGFFRHIGRKSLAARNFHSQQLWARNPALEVPMPEDPWGAQGRGSNVHC